MFYVASTGPLLSLFILVFVPIYMVYDFAKQRKERQRKELQAREERERERARRAEEARKAAELEEREALMRKEIAARHSDSDYVERILRCNLSDPSNANAMAHIIREEESGPAHGFERRCLERFEKEVLHL